MGTKHRLGVTAGTISAVLLLGLVVPGLVAPALASSAPNPSAPPQTWAYGAVHYRNASANTSGGQYSARAFFGWTVVYTLTNTSNTTFELEAQRTMGVRYDANLCAPSCANPRVSLGVSIRGIERATGFANFTTVGTVDENGTSVPALAITDSHALGAAYLNESFQTNRTLGGTTRSFDANLRVGAAGSAQVTFATALGLIPWNVAPGLGWNSSAAFSASGIFRTMFNWSISGNNGTGPVALNGSGGHAGQVNASGSAALMGSDLGNLTLANGLTVPVIVLAWTAGPFEGLDGVILMPRGFEVFAAGVHAWDAESQGDQSVSTARVDLALDLTHHRFRVAAAASLYQGSDTLAASAQGSGPVPAASAGSSSDLVQAQPISVASAQSTAGCLSNGCPSGAGGSGGSTAGRLLPFLVVGLVAVAVVGALGTVEYRRMLRRREQRRMSAGLPNSGFPNGGPVASYPYPPPAPGAIAPPSPPESPPPPSS